MKKLFKDIGKLGFNCLVDAGISGGMVITMLVAGVAWISECGYLGDEISGNLVDVGSDIKNIAVRCKNKLKKN